jgi:hypothetical protein
MIAGGGSAASIDWRGLQTRVFPKTNICIDRVGQAPSEQCFNSSGGSRTFAKKCYSLFHTYGSEPRQTKVPAGYKTH